MPVLVAIDCALLQDLGLLERTERAEHTGELGDLGRLLPRSALPDWGTLLAPSGLPLESKMLGERPLLRAAADNGRFIT